MKVRKCAIIRNRLQNYSKWCGLYRNVSEDFKTCWLGVCNLNCTSSLSRIVLCVGAAFTIGAERGWEGEGERG